MDIGDISLSSSPVFDSPRNGLPRTEICFPLRSILKSASKTDCEYHEARKLKHVSFVLPAVPWTKERATKCLKVSTRFLHSRKRKRISSVNGDSSKGRKQSIFKSQGDSQGEFSYPLYRSQNARSVNSCNQSRVTECNAQTSFVDCCSNLLDELLEFVDGECSKHSIKRIAVPDAFPPLVTPASEKIEPNSYSREYSSSHLADAAKNLAISEAPVKFQNVSACLPPTATASFIGFTSASGKRVIVSEDALSATKRLLVNDMKKVARPIERNEFGSRRSTSRDLSPGGNISPVIPPRWSLPRRHNNALAYSTASWNMSSTGPAAYDCPFSTASAKPVNVSGDALETSRAILSDNHNCPRSPP